MDILNIIDRDQELFGSDLHKYDVEITKIVQANRFLVIGGGGSIGQAVSKELFYRKPKALHIVDLNENYLVELVRDLRSSYGYLVADFDTFALDCGSPEFRNFIRQGRYDYVLNLSAMKHVRSENNPYCMFRMIQTNIINTITTIASAAESGASKYFCVSTDKAANPTNFMGASKCAMELCVMGNSNPIPVSAARFANVAFSNGSLLEGFRHRIEKQQPLSTPSDIQRFFITPRESGIICLFSTILGKNNNIYFPHNTNEMRLKYFLNIAENFLNHMGKKGIICENEEDARKMIKTIDTDKYWPINVFLTDTVGEKPFEEFYTADETPNTSDFTDLAYIDFLSDKTSRDVSDFLSKIQNINLSSDLARSELLTEMKRFVPTFSHIDGKTHLNGKM